MDSTLFQGSTLLISARSPFARRVRVAFHENSINFTEKVFDVFQPTPELWKANPLARVPTAILNNGRVLIDSNLILQALYESIVSPFMPQEQAKRLEVYQWSAIAAGVCEKTVEYFLETLRPSGTQDADLLKEIEVCLSRSLTTVEAELSRHGENYLVANGSEPTQADFDWAVALSYLKLRYPLNWEKDHPKTGHFLERLLARSSFQKTAPPPPVKA